MKRYPIIGIAGRKRQGKDEIAKHLLALGVVRFRYAFADPLRAMLKAGLRIDFDRTDPTNHKERAVAHLGVTPRHLMQTLGTEWGRNLIHPDIWVKEAQLFWLEQRNGAMVIDDVRFPNEADWIRLVGGLILHVQRDDAPSGDTHSSEDGLPILSGDALVTNNGTLDELRAQVSLLFLHSDDAQEAALRG